MVNLKVFVAAASVTYTTLTIYPTLSALMHPFSLIVFFLLPCVYHECSLAGCFELVNDIVRTVTGIRIELMS